MQGASTVWTWESQGIGNVAVNMISGNGQAGSPLLIATHGRGIYSNDPAVGMEEVMEKDMLQLYPNPCRGLMRIGSKDRLKSIKVFSTDGRLLMQKAIQTEEISIETTDWKSGMYLLEAEDSKGRRRSGRIMVP
jgi:hypothetical protein